MCKSKGFSLVFTDCCINNMPLSDIKRGLKSFGKVSEMMINQMMVQKTKLWAINFKNNSDTNNKYNPKWLAVMWGVLCAKEAKCIAKCCTYKYE